MRRILHAVCCLAALSAAGCSPQQPGPEPRVPAGAAAVVDGKTVSLRDVQRWRRIVAAQQADARTPGTSVPDAPTFTRCTAAGRAAAKRAGKTAVSDSSLKAQCKSAYDTLTEQALRVLITERWLAAETARLGLTVTDRAVNLELAQLRTGELAARGALERKLARTGQTIADARRRILGELRSEALRQHALADVSPPTRGEVSVYYAANPKLFSAPQTRTVDVVLAADTPTARTVRTAITAGMSFRAAAARWSQDPVSQDTGRWTNVPRAQLEGPIADAVFSARPGVLHGPVSTTFGSYIFRVRAATPATSRTLGQVRAQLTQELTHSRQDAAVATFGNAWEARQRARTICAPAHRIDLCANAPAKAKPKATPDEVPEPRREP